MALLKFKSIRLPSIAFGLALIGVFCRTAGADPTASVSDATLARVPGPHVFVGEQYDVSGTVIRAVSLPIVNGLVQPQQDAIYNNIPSATLTTQPNGLILSNTVTGAEIDTLSPLTGEIVSRLHFAPVSKQFFPVPTELHVDAAGRIYAAFYYQTRNSFQSALAIYAPGAQGDQGPYAILPIAGGFSEGIATLGNAVYVSATSRGAIDIFAPVQQPKRIGEITGLHKPAGVSFDGHGELYVCNAGDGTVLALPPTERGSVKPDRIISVPGHRLCMLQPGFFSNGNEMAIAGESLFVAGDAAQTIFQLNPGLNGPQKPLASVLLAGQNNPWQAIDVSVGPR